ncbi:MAG: ABC transporter permease subunit, partial [Opitutaceae bacterium]|nr:ABC transporter permease subunit [Verrucomicrobiales bacterium]
MITFLPVVERELRIAARRDWTYWTRIGAAGAAFVVAVFMVLFWMMADTGGMGLFTTLSFFGLIICLVDGIRTTADCLSEEKREGTLGLLFLTDLSGIDVVLGKFASSALRSFYGLLATFPVLSLTLMMGGVTPGEFWAMVLALTAILFLSQSVAMWVSSVSWHERRAVTATIATLAALVIVPLIPSWIGLITQYPGLWRVDLLSPSRLYVSAFGGGLTSPLFLKALIANLLVAWLFLALACWSVRRNWQSKPDGSRLSRSRQS